MSPIVWREAPWRSSAVAAECRNTRTPVVGAVIAACWMARATVWLTTCGAMGRHGARGVRKTVGGGGGGGGWSGVCHIGQDGITDLLGQWEARRAATLPADHQRALLPVDSPPAEASDIVGTKPETYHQQEHGPIARPERRRRLTRREEG